MKSQKGIQKFSAAFTLDLEIKYFLPWKTALSYLPTKQINAEGVIVQ